MPRTVIATLAVGERIQIGDATLVVVAIVAHRRRGWDVKLGIDAPRRVPIDRLETHCERHAEPEPLRPPLCGCCGKTPVTDARSDLCPACAAQVERREQ